MQADQIDQAVQNALHLWPLSADASARLMNVAENRTYLVQSGNCRAVLRAHRPDYHSENSIRSELDWIEALLESGDVPVPSIRRGRDGRRIQRLESDALPVPHRLVMFEFIEGCAPDESGDLRPLFRRLGEISAALHRHAVRWRAPPGFTRFHWNLETVFGARARWGRWQDAPNVTEEIARLLARLESTLAGRLRAYGRTPDRYGLIHADMRLANLIVSQNDTWVIDFDDCGYSWFSYDFAAGVSFIEDDPRIPEFKEEWLAGYRSLRTLSEADIREIDSMVMLRRMALLAWVGSRIESPEAQNLAAGFAAGTADLADAYLQRHG